MKRLLAYLFIVLGFGLTFNVSANAKIVFCEVRFITYGGEIIPAGQGGNYRKKYDVEPVYFTKNKCYFAQDSFSSKKADHPQITLENYVDQILSYRIRIGQSSVSNDFDVRLNVGKSIIKEFEKNKFDTSYLISVLEDKYRIPKKYLEISKKTQIAKAEETKQEENNSLNYKARICAINLWDNNKKKNIPNKYEDILIFKDRGVSCSVMINRNVKDLSYKDYLKILEYPEKYFISDEYSITKGAALTNSICLNKKNKIHNLKPNCEKNSKELYVVGGNGNYLYLSESSKNKITIVAKKVIKDKKDKNILDIKFCYGFGSKNDVFPTLDLANCWSRLSSYEAFKRYKPNKNICYNKKSHLVTSLTKCYPENEIYYVKYNGKNFIIDTNKTKIAKKVPEKNNEDIVKLEEPKQEEFKPENKDIDNDAPVIEIAEAITVDSQAYTLKGKVKDKSQIFLTIDGRQVQVKKGKFELERFNIDPDNAEEIKIVAYDKWNNRSEKTVKITIDLQSTDVARVYENLNPNNVRAKTDNNKIAIIIGIEKYENLTNLDAKYANRDAKAFKAYATRALGIKPSNIKMLIDDKAKRGNTLEAFKIWLPKMAGKGDKDIYIFFAGHGLASENGKDLYVLPQDGNAKLLDDTAITRLELISLIKKVNPKSVTMFFDTCYSGQTRDEEMLVASLLRPIQIIPEEQDTPDNFTIFSASNYDQVSGGIEEAKHGMFSYYLMLGLEGNADENKDKKITNGELIAYLKDNVSLEALTQNREQDPMLAGDPDNVLMSYR